MQQIPTPIDQYGMRTPQVVTHNTPLLIYPLQFLCDTQIVVPQTSVPEEVPQHPVMLNVQNPPPWIQNRPQNVIYLQQMPNQILPYVQQNMVQTVYTPQINYQIAQPRQVNLQELYTPVMEVPSIIPRKTDTNTFNERTPQRMPLLKQLLSQKPLGIQQEKPLMLSQHVQTDFPLKINRNPGVSTLNAAVTKSKPNETITKEVKEFSQLNPNKHVGATDKNDNKDEIPGEDIGNDVPSHVKNKVPGEISIKPYKPFIRPIVTPTGMKSTINSIPVKLRALDPTQVISIPNYGTITNYTVLNEDNDVRIPQEIQNISTIPTMNTDNIITAKLNEKNEITFIQNAQNSENKYLPATAGENMPSSITKTVSIGTNTLVSNDIFKETNEAFPSVSNEIKTAGTIVANRKTTATSIGRSMPILNEEPISVPNETLLSNNIRKTVPKDNNRLILSETTGSFVIEPLKSVAAETPKSITKEALKVGANETSETPNKIPNDTPKSASIKPETIKSIEVKKLNKKTKIKNTRSESNQTLDKMMAKAKQIEAKAKEIEATAKKTSASAKKFDALAKKVDAPAKKVEAKPKKGEAKQKTLKDIKKNIAAKDAANEKCQKNDVYILTHVLDGHVIQESNVAFPIYRPAKENFTYEPSHEVTRIRSSEDPFPPLKNLQIDSNAETSEEPVKVSPVPNRPVATDPAGALTDTDEIRAVTNESQISAETNSLTQDGEASNKTHEVAAMSIDPPEALLNTDEIRAMTNEIQVSAKTNSLNQDGAASNEKTKVATMPIVLPEVENMPIDQPAVKEYKPVHRPKVAVVSIQRYEATQANNRAGATAISTDRPEDATTSNHRHRIPMVAIERLQVRPMSINPHEVAGGSVYPLEVPVDVAIDSTNGSIGGNEVNVSSGSQKESEASRSIRENPFLMLQRSTVERWNTDTLSSFLTRNNWKNTAEKLKDQEIDGEALLLANKDQLIKIGIADKQAEFINDFILNCNSVLIESD